MAAYEVNYRYGYLQPNPGDPAFDVVHCPGWLMGRENKTIVVADTVLEAIQKVYAEIGQEEAKRHAYKVEQARKEDTFPPEPEKIVVTKISVEELYRKVIA